MRVMLDSRHFAAFWQQIFEVPAPARRIFAFPQAFSLRPIEHSFDSVANTVRGLRLGRPYGLDRLEN
jgi:hypothetical protein